MSKGNMLLGYARGKVGDVVMARALGKQQTRAYNDKPKNPKTESQMNQRVKMLNLINFYKFSKNYLQYEKGGSNTKFSTFNKFVRFNIASTPNYLTKEQFLNNVTIPNDYYYSIGSLAWAQPNTEPMMNTSTQFAGQLLRFPLSVTFDNDDSVTYVLRTLFSNFGAKTTNAILNIFGVVCDPTDYIIKDSYSLSINPIDFEGKTYAELRSGLSLNSGNITMQLRSTDENYMLEIQCKVPGLDTNYGHCYAACWSTVANGRLKVSTSKIKFNGLIETPIRNKYQTDQARIEAINSYKVGEPIELRTGTPID